MSKIEKRRREIDELVGSTWDSATERPIPAVCTTAELAELLSISIRNVDMLCTRGVLTKADRGRYNSRDCIAAYIAYCKRGKSADLDSEKLRLTKEQADKIAIQNQIASGVLLSAGEVRSTWTSLVIDLRQAMLAIPSRLPELSLQVKMDIDREIRSALLALSSKETDRAAPRQQIDREDEE